ncbi:MAG: NAD-dependent epimerase/dehydratase family protein [Euzebya sp.]
MTTAAVLGVSQPVGRAVLNRLATASSVQHLLAVDAGTPAMPHPHVELRTMDPRDRLLPLALEGVEVVVHAAFSDDLSASPDSLYGANVGGTRNVLDAVAKVGVRHLIVLSSAMVYGAHHDNPLPLEESAGLRANPGFAYGYQRLLVEELVAEWAEGHPGTKVTVLRLAPVMGPGVNTAVVRRLLGPRLLVPTGHGAPWQFVHIDDVAAAVDLVIDRTLDGVFNVAAHGWLSAGEVANYSRRRMLEVGQSTLTEVLHRGAQLSLSPAPAEVMPYLIHPWVLATEKLRAAGWQPVMSNAEILSQFRRDHDDEWAVGRLSFSRRGLRRAALATTGLLGLALWRVIRR